MMRQHCVAHTGRQDRKQCHKTYALHRKDSLSSSSRAILWLRVESGCCGIWTRSSECHQALKEVTLYRDLNLRSRFCYPSASFRQIDWRRPLAHVLPPVARDRSDDSPMRGPSSCWTQRAVHFHQCSSKWGQVAALTSYIIRQRIAARVWSLTIDSGVLRSLFNS